MTNDPADAMTDADAATDADATSGGDATLEFTVEPFVEDNPGPHVTAAIEAVANDDRVSTEIGPFGTAVSGEQESVIDAANAMLVAAFANGASRVVLQVTRR